MARCEWETDELQRDMMVVIQNMHDLERSKSDNIDDIFEEIKLGKILDGAVQFIENTPVYTSSIRKNPVIKSINKFYDAAYELFNVSLHCPEMVWCLYRSGSAWDNFEIGDTRTYPTYLSTSTSIEFVSFWKADKGNVLFKILAPGDTKILAIESVYNPKFDIVSDTNFEYEITIPPGKMTIIDKSKIMINYKTRILVTVEYAQLDPEEAIQILKNMKSV